MQQAGACTLTQLLNMMPNWMTALVLNNERMSKTRNEEQFVFCIGPPPKISMVSAAPGSHFGIHGSLPQILLNPKILVDVSGSIEAGSCIDVCGQSYHRRLSFVLFMQTSMVCTAAWIQGNCLTLGYCWGLCWWPIQNQRAMLMTVLCTAIRHHAEIHCLYWNWRPCRCCAVSRKCMEVHDPCSW